MTPQIPSTCDSLMHGRPILFWVLVLVRACQSGTAVWAGVCLTPCLTHHHHGCALQMPVRESENGAGKAPVPARVRPSSHFACGGAGVCHGAPSTLPPCGRGGRKGYEHSAGRGGGGGIAQNKSANTVAAAARGDKPAAALPSPHRRRVWRRRVWSLARAFCRSSSDSRPLPAAPCSGAASCLRPADRPTPTTRARQRTPPLPHSLPPPPLARDHRPSATVRLQLRLERVWHARRRPRRGRRRGFFTAAAACLRGWCWRPATL